MNWRPWNNAIHRDLGYLCFGLTIVYVISGVAVNHVDSWNPSYRVEHLRSRLDAPIATTVIDRPFIDALLARLGEKRRYLNSFQPDPQSLQVFVEGNTISVNLATERASIEYVPEGASSADFRRAIEGAGYKMIGTVDGEEGAADREARVRAAELRTLRNKLIFAGALGVIIFLGSFPELFPWIPAFLSNWYVLWALSTPVQFWAGWQFYVGALA